MGCSSCGQKYVGARTAYNGQRYQLVRNRRGQSMRVPISVETTKTDPSSGTIQAQPEAGIVIPPGPANELYDPSTGILKAVIMTGSKGESVIPNNTAQPETFEIESPNEEATEKKEE